MIVTGSFFVYIQAYLTQMLSMQNIMKTHKEPLRPSAPLDAIYCDYPVVYTVIQLLLLYILLYISLYLQYIWYRFSLLCKSILLFGEMAKLVLTVVYTVIQLLLLYILLYISYIYSILLQKLCLLPPVNSVPSSCNSVTSIDNSVASE